MIRSILHMIAATVACTVIGGIVGAILLAGTNGFGVLLGATIGMFIGARLAADRDTIVSARELMERQTLANEFRNSPHPVLEDERYRVSSARLGSRLRILASRPHDMASRRAHSRYFSQKHHDLQPSDIGLSRKSKRKRKP